MGGWRRDSKVPTPYSRLDLRVETPSRTEHSPSAMDALGEIEIRIEGSVGAQKLTPAQIDIDEIREILAQASVLLFPAEKRSQRLLISYEIVEGSVRHKFRTVMQSVIGFGAVLTQFRSQRQIDFLHERSAVAIERLQHLAADQKLDSTLQFYDSRIRTVPAAPSISILSPVFSVAVIPGIPTMHGRRSSRETMAE